MNARESLDEVLRRNRERPTGLWWRVWPTALTGLVGLTIAAGAAWLLGSTIQDHDTSMIVTMTVGCIAGVRVGLICQLVWDQRDRMWHQ